MCNQNRNHETMTYYVKLSKYGSFPSGDDTKMFEITEELYNDIETKVEEKLKGKEARQVWQGGREG